MLTDSKEGNGCVRRARIRVWGRPGIVCSCALVALAVACSPSSRDHEPTGTLGSPILGGSVASAYPEAALVDLYAKGQLIAACSGAVISPLVVLTAGHCVTGEPGAIPDGWVVTAPYAGKQPVKVAGSAVYDWAGGTSTIVPTQHDLGVLFLDSEIMLQSYPTLSQTELTDGTQVVNLGRINNGTLSTTDLYASPPVAVSDGSEVMPPFPYDYSAMDVIESGDSGGPDEVVGMTPHLIVAVNSGEGGGSEVLARTDPIYAWIEMEIQTHVTPPVIDAGADAQGDASTVSDADSQQPDTSFPMNGPPPGVVAFPNTSKGCAVGRAGRSAGGPPRADVGWAALLGLAWWRRRRSRTRPDARARRS
jgi:hypothetical protein